MTFKKAVEKTPHLEDAWRPGLQALRASDKAHVEVEDARHLAGSADIDAALASVQPHAHRWDYGIGYKARRNASERVYWVEVHPASSKEVKSVLDKLRWLKDWLEGEGRALGTLAREFVWVSTGKTSFTLTSPQQKRFAQLGLRHTGRVLRISATD